MNSYKIYSISCWSAPADKKDQVEESTTVREDNWDNGAALSPIRYQRA